MPHHAEQPLDLQSAREALSDLYQQVATHRQRVEIVDGNTSETCIIIARSELESLEQALQILSDTRTMKQARKTLAAAAKIDTVTTPGPHQPT